MVDDDTNAMNQLKREEAIEKRLGDRQSDFADLVMQEFRGDYSEQSRTGVMAYDFESRSYKTATIGQMVNLCFSESPYLLELVKRAASEQKPDFDTYFFLRTAALKFAEQEVT